MTPDEGSQGGAGARHLVQLHALVLLIAATAPLGKLITLSTPALVAWRTALAALGAFAWLHWRGSHRPFDPRRSLTLVGIGGLIGLHWLCFFGAIQLANISICLAGMATTSLFTAFTEPFFERRRVRPFEVLLGLLVAVGILLVFGFQRGHHLGLLVALAGALLASLFLVLNRRFIRGGSDPMGLVGWEMIGACLVALAFVPLLPGGSFGGLLDWHGLDWLWILILAWFCTTFAHSWGNRLLRHLSAYTLGLAINFEPVYGIIAAIVLFQENRELQPGFYLGTLAILAANLLHPVLLKRFTRKA